MSLNRLSNDYFYKMKNAVDAEEEIEFHKGDEAVSNFEMLLLKQSNSVQARFSLNESQESLKMGSQNQDGVDMNLIYQGLDQSSMAMQYAEDADNILLVAESQALMAKIYWRFLKKSDKASECFSKMNQSVNILSGSSNDPKDCSWFIEAKQDNLDM